MDGVRWGAPAEAERERGRVEETAGASEGRRGTSAFRSKLPGEANTNKQRRGAEEAGRKGRGRKGEEGKATNAVPGKLKEAFYWIVFFFFPKPAVCHFHALNPCGSLVALSTIRGCYEPQMLGVITPTQRYHPRAHVRVVKKKKKKK